MKIISEDIKNLGNGLTVMYNSSEPTHWYTHNCEYCYSETKIHFTDEKPDNVFCPVCGTATEPDSDSKELNFNY